MAVVIPGVSAVPLVEVLLEFCDVNVAESGDETTHDRMPEVTQPMCALSPLATRCGVATITIEGRATCTVHDAVLV